MQRRKRPWTWPTSPTGIAKVMTRPMSLLARVAAPFIWLLETSSDLLMRILPIKPNENNC